MVEESHDNSNTQTKTSEEVTFTAEQQEKVNSIIQQRVNEINAGKQKAIDDAVAKALKDQANRQRIASLEGEEKLKAEYQAKLEEVENERKAQAEELATAQRALAISKAEAQLASHNLPTEFAINLLGEDDKATAKNIETFNTKINALVTAKVNESLARGAPKTSADASGSPTWKQEIDAAFASKV